MSSYELVEYLKLKTVGEKLDCIAKCHNSKISNFQLTGSKLFKKLVLQRRVLRAWHDIRLHLLRGLPIVRLYRVLES